MRCTTHPQSTEDHPSVLEPRLDPVRSEGVPASHGAEVVDVGREVALQCRHCPDMVAELLAAGS